MEIRKIRLARDMGSAAQSTRNVFLGDRFVGTIRHARKQRRGKFLTYIHAKAAGRKAETAFDHIGQAINFCVGASK